MHKLKQLPAYVKHLLVCANLFSAGNCVIASFLVVYFVEILKLPAWQTAVIMSTAPITSKVMKMFIGFIGDRVGYRYTIGIGFLFSCIGNIGYASTQNFYLLVYLHSAMVLGTPCMDRRLKLYSANCRKINESLPIPIICNH